MYQQNRNMNYQYMRDLPANGLRNSNRMERASNWRTMNSSAGNYNSNAGGNYNNGNSMVQYPSLQRRSVGNLSQNRPSRPQNTTINRSRNGPSNDNQSTRHPIKRPAPMQTSRSAPSAGAKTTNNKQPHGLELPPLGEPGGLDDPLRKGLSGAGKKWYARYLAQGLKPEAARQKAEEHRREMPRTTDQPPSKRPRPSNPSKPNTSTRLANSKVSKAEQKTGPTRPIRVAVLPKEYPRDSLQPEELVELEEAIIDEVALGYDKKIHFTGVEHRNNMIIIECNDWDTYGWLKIKIPNLSSWKGVPLLPRMENRIPKIYNISVHLPCSAGKTHEQILALIKAQNDGLLIDHWLVQSSNEENEGQTLEIMIDGFSYEAICKNDNTLCYRYDSVPVVKIETKAEAADDQSVKAEGDSEAVEPAKPATNKSVKVEEKEKSKPTRSVKAAVLPKEYPRVTLDQNQLKEIEEAIIDEVAAGNEKKIRFTGVEHSDNMLIIDCKDWDTFTWMKTALPKLSGWKGAPLVACLERSVPKKIEISVHLPRSSDKTHENLLALIKAQNEGLQTDRWHINSSTEENDGQTLNITIDGFSYRYIGKNGNALCYRYGTVPVVKIDEAQPETADDPTAKEEEVADDEEGEEINGDEVEINEEDEEMPENGAGDNEEN